MCLLHFYSIYSYLSEWRFSFTLVFVYDVRQIPRSQRQTNLPWLYCSHLLCFAREKRLSEEVVLPFIWKHYLLRNRVTIQEHTFCGVLFLTHLLFPDITGRNFVASWKTIYAKMSMRFGLISSSSLQLTVVHLHRMKLIIKENWPWFKTQEFLFLIFIFLWSNRKKNYWAWRCQVQWCSQLR